MKKRVKLQLSRETLRNLAEGNLQEVAGGVSVRTCPTHSCDATCDCSIATFYCSCNC